MASVSPTEQQQQWLHGLVTQQEWLDGRGVSPIANNLEADSGTVMFGFMNDEQDHTCPICLELLLRPVQLSCSHRFCRGCWARVLQGRDVRATAHLTGSVACPYRCEVRPVVPEVDEALASQLESHFAARYSKRASSTSLPDEERRVAEVNEWAAQGCKPDDTPGVEEVTRTQELQERTENWLARAVIIIALALAGLMFMLMTRSVLWFVFSVLGAAVILLDAFLIRRMKQLNALAVTPAQNATPPAEGDALPESRHFVRRRLWSQMSLLLRSTRRALASSSTSTRAATRVSVRRPPQAHAPQPQSLSEIEIEVL